MRLTTLFILFGIVISKNTSYAELTNCPTPVPDPPYNYVYDLSLKPKLGWGIEWWYYTFNLNLGLEYYPSVSVTTFAIRSPLYNCTSPRDQLVEMYIGIRSSVFEPIEYKYSTILNFDAVYNGNYLNISYEDVHFIRYESLNTTYIRFNSNEFTVQDGRGYYLQGDGGFIKTGPQDVDNYYGGSFVRLDVSGVLENGILVRGVGNGEHVYGSIFDTKTDTKYDAYSGWHCHYIHSSPCVYNNKVVVEHTRDLQYCMGDLKNGTRDLYSYGMYIDEFGRKTELGPFDLEYGKSFHWNDQFYIDWTLLFNQTKVGIPKIELTPIQNMYNQTHRFDNIIWWDGGVSTNDGDYFGILEMFHL